MRRLILPALGLLVIGLAVQASVWARGPDPADQAGWFLMTEESELKLVYGLPQSDHVALMLICTPGDLHISVYGDIEPDLASLRTVQQGPSQMDPLSLGDAWGMTLSADDPGLWLLAQRGYLPVLTGEGRTRIEATAKERQMANRFLNACASLHA